MFKLLRRLVVAVLVLVGIVALAGAAAFVSGGISTRQAPGSIELALAPKLRSLAIPREARERKNPAADTAAVVSDGMEHFADHCAVCHGNDGGGDTEMGRGLYPRAPDMRLPATQNLTDGELFYIIENGVKLTGMPAWARRGPRRRLELEAGAIHPPPAEALRRRARSHEAAQSEGARRVEGSGRLEALPRRGEAAGQAGAQAWRQVA